MTSKLYMIFLVRMKRAINDFYNSESNIRTFTSLKLQVLLGEEFDKCDAYLTIHAGIEVQKVVIGPICSTECLQILRKRRI